MYYFTDCKDVTDIKRAYLRLCHVHHPDKGGNTATMQDINTQYHDALHGNDGHVFTGTDDKTRTYYYNQTKEQTIIDKIAELLAADLNGCEIRLIGSWLWITGETKKHREALKAAKCKWHSKRTAWYFRTPGKRAHYNNRASLDDLAAAYGCEVQTKTDGGLFPVPA